MKLTCYATSNKHWLQFEADRERGSETRSVTVRRAEPLDGDAFIELVVGLADYEKLAPPDAAGRGD